jgi:predicted DNA-binding ribbon-helix-helix protein
MQSVSRNREVPHTAEFNQGSNVTMTNIPCIMMRKEKLGMTEPVSECKSDTGTANSNHPDGTGKQTLEKKHRNPLTIRNIIVEGQRTTIRLEPEMWQALHEIADREKCQVNDICSFVHHHRKPGSSLTASIRVFVMIYFKCACTEEGHRKAGHGDFKMLQFNHVRERERGNGQDGA